MSGSTLELKGELAVSHSTNTNNAFTLAYVALNSIVFES